MKAIVCSGVLFKLVVEYVEYVVVDFVVMGFYGVSGKNEYFIGFNI